MSLTDLSLCNQALMRIGAHPITAFDQGIAEADIADQLYTSARDSLLSAHSWSFATAQSALSEAETAPVADYDYAFDLPEDFIRALSAGTDSKGRGQGFRIEQNALHADVESIVLTYVFRPEETTFPPFFATALIARLAADFCIPVTENTSRSEMLYRLADKEFEKAVKIDAQQDGPRKITQFVLTDNR